MAAPFAPQEDSWDLGLPPSLGTPLPRRMRALTIHRDQYGPPSRSVRLEDVPAPRLKPNEAKRVLVAILATGPNFNTNFAALGLPVPVFGKGDAASVHVPGSDAVGIVVDAGPGVSTVKVGQAVILDSWTGRNIRGYETHDGFNAQFAVVDEERAVPATGALRAYSPERLAAMLLTYGTAYRAVVERLSVRPGDAVLVMGGGKGTSFPGAQIAKSLGARVLLVGSNPELARGLIARGMADAFVDRRSIPKEAFGVIPAGTPYAEWERRTEPFRRALLEANGGKPVDKIFEHTGGENFPLLISALSPGGTLAFFGATGKGLKGEYKETFFHDGRRFVMDARWVWMRQKQVLFRRGKPAAIFDELALPPGRRVLVWGADRTAREFVAAAQARSAEVVVIASAAREKRGIADLSRMGVPPTRILDRDGFSLPGEMPDPLTPEGRLNPEYASGFTRPAQALGKALWKVFGPRVSPDVVVDRVDQDTLHFSTFVARDFDEKDVFPCGTVVLRGKSDLSIRGSHMYGASQAADAIRLLSAGKIAMDQEDLEITDLAGLPALQQMMLDGTMRKPKGVALVQADRPGRTVADYEEAFRGEIVQAADPAAGKFIDVRMAGDVAVVTITRPDALNALSEELLSQFAAVVREAGSLGTIGGRTVKAIVLAGAGRSFVAGADVKEFHGKTADVVDALAWKNITVFTELEQLPIPVVALVDGFALGGGNELAMSAHYRVVTENAVLGQPEVKLGIIPGYGGMQRLPRLIGPEAAAEICVNGEPVDGSTAVSLGWADEFVPSSSALPRALGAARDFAEGVRPVPRREWDALAAAGKEELARLFARPEVRAILDAPTPGKESAADLRAARLAAARDALLAMRHGYARGFEEGLRNDARKFGAVAASAGGQEWVGRFLAKDAAQSSFLTLLQPAGSGEGRRPPITKKAPGDRPITFVEIGEIASILKDKMNSGGVTPLPKKILNEVILLLKDRPSPAILAEIDPGKSGNVGARIASLLSRGKISVRVVDLGPEEGFRRENARPTCEVLLVEKDGEVFWEGKKRFRVESGAFPRVFLPKAFLERNASRPHVVYQAIVHPILEWVFGYPHMIAVLCESAYNAIPPEGPGSLSDLNRYIAEGAGRDSDFPYFDRILVDAYEPEDFRKEELSNFFGDDERKVGTVLSRAREMGARYREFVSEVRSGVLGGIAARRIVAGRAALDEGDADGALRLLRELVTSGETPSPYREEAAEVIDMAIRSYALPSVPTLEGKVIAITGGGTGIGRSLAMEAARRGGNVVITGRRPSPLLETKADMDDLIRHLGLANRTLFVQGDVSDPKYVGEMFEQIEREFGRIDVLYNNAGVSGPVVFGSVYEEGHFDEYREAVNIHLTGSWLASLEAARIMEGQPGGGTIVMVGTFYSESIHHHVLHAYPGRLPYTSAQSAKLALGEYLAWALAGKNISVLSLNPSAVSTERLQRGSGVFDKGSKARGRIGRNVPPEALERDTLERTVGRAFVEPADFAALALGVVEGPFRRTMGGARLPVGGVTYEQAPGVLPSPAALPRYPDLVGKVALVVVAEALSGDVPLVEASAGALARAGAAVVLTGGRAEVLEPVVLKINARGGEGTATISPVTLSHPAHVQELFDGLPRVDLLLYFTGSVDWKRPLTNLPHDEWTARVDRFGLIPRFLCWQAERRMDRDGTDGTIVLVGPDLSGVPTIRERNLVQVFQAMLRPAVATEAMERALMRKANAEGTSPGPVSNVNIGLVLPGRTDGRNRQARPDATAASVLWFLEDGKSVSGVVLLPDEQNAIAALPPDPVEIPGTASGKVAVVTGGIRNLGKEIGLRLAAERGTVVIGSRYPRTGAQDPGEAEKARGELAAADGVLTRMRRSGGRALWVHTDVARPGSVRALLSETRNRFGRIDLLVNNAGAGGDFSRVGEVMRDHGENFSAVLAANFLGPWEGIIAAREILRTQPGGGSIVNVSTHYADHPYLFRTIYTVSKILLKALAKTTRAELAEVGISIADVAPTLIAGPRMEWVMRNYATKFSSGFDDFPEVSAAGRKALTDLFLRSFDGALSGEERAAASGKFLSALRAQKMPKGSRERIESWYGRIGEWFRSTVPTAPPVNEEVAEAVLFAAKDGRFLENPFLSITTLPPFSSFPPSPGPRRTLSAGEPGTLVSTGDAGSLHQRFHEALSRKGAAVTSLSDAEMPDGQARITRPAGHPSVKGARGRAQETQHRTLDLSDPRVVEPWLDNTLVGAPPPAFAVLIVGATTGGKGVLDFTAEERLQFRSRILKAVTLFAESARAVRDGGHLVVVGPPDAAGEGQLTLAALRQTVRTFLAEQHFLPASKSVRVSFLAGHGPGAERETEREVMGILEGARPPRVVEIPVGYPRP
ncbi:MAG: SDR family NAD(P)-dependent oxidoreductase [Actinomycetota bacterium]